MARKTISLIFAVLLLGPTFGCSGSDEDAPDAPAQAAHDWYVAVNTMEALEADALVCQSKREEFRREMEAGSTFLIFGQLLLGGAVDIELDASEVEFSTVEQGEGRAIVEAKGEMRAAVGGSISSEILNERWLMVQENGEWKWCGDASETPVQNIAMSEHQILTHAAQDFVQDILQGSTDTAERYFDSAGSQPPGEITVASEQLFGTGTGYSPLDTDKLRACFEKIPLDRVSFKAEPRPWREDWSVWIEDKEAKNRMLTTDDGSTARIAFFVDGSIPDSDFYYTYIFVYGCE